MLSGGANNSSPALSLGGDPSAYPVSQISLNNLFDDFTEEDSRIGKIDYRCIYAFNENPTETLFDMKLYNVGEYPDGASVSIGLLLQSEQHVITLPVPLFGGFILVTHESGENFYWTPAPLGTMSEILQDWLRSVDVDQEVTVTHNGFSSIYISYSDFRFRSMIQLDSYLFEGVAQIQRITAGSPINSTAALISGVNPPSGVSFRGAGEDNAFVLGKFQPGEGFPIWIRRVLEPEASPAFLDGFLLRISGKPEIV